MNEPGAPRGFRRDCGPCLMSISEYLVGSGNERYEDELGKLYYGWRSSPSVKEDDSHELNG